MTNREFLSLLEEILEADPGSLKGDEKLAALERWDSLAVVSLIAVADEKFGVTLSPRDIARARSLGDITSLLGDRITP